METKHSTGCKQVYDATRDVGPTLAKGADAYHEYVSSDHVVFESKLSGGWAPSRKEVMKPTIALTFRRSQRCQSIGFPMDRL
jgi:hypothetical protein